MTHPDPCIVVEDVTEAVASWLDELAMDRGALLLHLKRLPTASQSTLLILQDEQRMFVKLARKIRNRDWMRHLRPMLEDKPKP